MAWNHRLVRRHENGESWIELTEVLYRIGTPVTFITEYTPRAETVAEMKSMLSKIKFALERPVLDERTDFLEAPH